MSQLEYLANLLAYEFLIFVYLTPLFSVFPLVLMFDAFATTPSGRIVLGITALACVCCFFVGSWIAHNASSRHVLGGEGFFEAFTGARREVLGLAWLCLAFLPIVGWLFQRKPRK